MVYSTKGGSDTTQYIRNLELNCQYSYSSSYSEIVACEDFICANIFPY